MILIQVQLEIFKVLVKDDEFNCFDDILVYIKKLLEPENSIINEFITICKLLLSLVNPATSAAGEQSFSATRRLKTWLRSTMTQDRFSHLTILDNHKERTDKLLSVANEFVGRNENRKRNFGIFKETDLNL